ncbi:MAG TPA: hypothetical protein VLK29_03055 [Luteimonas sp.]|nr:hypothetical protein [Luteimonas sp.]
MALVLLSLGLMVKPVLAAACEVDDLRSAHAATAAGSTDKAGGAVAGSDEVVATGTGDVRAMASTAETGADLAGDTCCPGKVCNACCTSATVLPLASVASLPAPVPAHVEASTALTPGPVTHPVDVRPPINA